MPQITARLKLVCVLICGFATAFLALSTSAHAQQKRLYLANDDHTDYMWTADAETYAGVFTDMLEIGRASCRERV